MKNLIKVAFFSSILTAAMVYVILEWRPLRSELSRPPEVSWASPTSTAAPERAVAGLTDDERNNIDIYQKYSQGVVNVTSTSVACCDFLLRPVPQSGMGSGAIIDTAGHIVTNYHVIRDAELLEVTLPNKTKHKARVVGADPNNDLAVIQIDAPRGLVPIPMGTSKGLLVGQKVLAIGNPFGLDRTMTTGIISALGRSIQAENGRIIDDIIQTDASINHGNSGGPLLNNEGQIIGINAAILSPNDAGNYGIGFAIPADTVHRITDEILRLGYVRHAYIGIAKEGTGDLEDNPGLAKALGLDTDHGVLIIALPPGGPLQRAGIREANRRVRVGRYVVPTGGDVILAINGKNVNSFLELASEVDRYKPGDRVTVTVLRDDRKLDVPITLEEAPRR
jgi:S1-C subfamily serine protease